MSLSRISFLARKYEAFKRRLLGPITSLSAYFSYRQTGRLPAPANVAVAGLSRRDMQLYLHPWYHDFAPLGVATPQEGGHFPANQRCKAPILEAMVKEAIGAVGDSAETAEIFCADGYYSIASTLWGASRATGIDWNPYHIERARLAARLIGVADRTEFRQGNVYAVEGTWDILMNLGGLYHIADPIALLRQSHAWTRRYMIVQTVYSLANETADYFETPAPGWTWGCRFSLPRFEAMLAETGWKVLRLELNELTGNDRPEDRGSVYALCESAEKRGA